MNGKIFPTDKYIFSVNILAVYRGKVNQTNNGEQMRLKSYMIPKLNRMNHFSSYICT